MRPAPAAREARDRPDGARHPPRLHRRARQAARVPGPRPHRRPDHRRLHRARRRSQRPLGDAAGAVGRADRRQRRHLPGAGAEGARPRARWRCAATASGSTCRWRSSSGLVRTTTVARILERDDFAKRNAAHAPISMLELLYPLLQGYDSVAVRGRRRARRDRPEVQPAARPRHPDAPTAQPEQVILTMPILPGIDGERKMSKSLRQLHRRHRAAGGDLRQDPAAARRGAGDVVRAAARRAAAGGPRRPRDAKRALARALVARFHDAAAAEAAEAGTSTASTASTGRPRRCRRRARRPTATASCICRRCSPRRSASRRSEARRALAQGGVKARRGAAGRRRRWTGPPASWTARVLQLGKRRFARLRAGRLRPLAAGTRPHALRQNGYIPAAAPGVRKSCGWAHRSGGSATSTARVRYTSRPHREPMLSRALWRNPLPRGTAVFENSTACAPIGRNGPAVVCVQVSKSGRPPRQRGWENGRARIDPVRCPSSPFVYVGRSQWASRHSP